MTPAELEVLDAARPPCQECGEPVARAEVYHTRDDAGEWRAHKFVLVCAAEHRVIIEADA